MLAYLINIFPEINITKFYFSVHDFLQLKYDFKGVSASFENFAKDFYYLSFCFCLTSLLFRLFSRINYKTNKRYRQTSKFRMKFTFFSRRY